VHELHNPPSSPAAATIDEIAGGRFVLGLGAGWNETEFRAFGFPYEQRSLRFEEAFTIIPDAAQEGQVDSTGVSIKPRLRAPAAARRGAAAPDRLERSADAADRGGPHVSLEHLVRDTDNTPGASPRSATSSPPPVATSARSARDRPDRAVGTSGCRRPGRTEGRHDPAITRAALRSNLADGLRAYATFGVSEVQVS